MKIYISGCFSKLKRTLLICLSVGLIACKSGDGSGSNTFDINTDNRFASTSSDKFTSPTNNQFPGNSGSLNGGGGSSPGPIAPGTTLSYLDCTNLDPKKIYLLGTLQQGLAGREAIIDPEDPTHFCLGFGESSPIFIKILEDGKIFYSTYNRDSVVNILKPDYLTIDTSFNQWRYPKDPLSNDIPISTISGSQAAFNPANGEVYIFYNFKILTQTGDVYLPDAYSLLGFTSDGTLLLVSSYLESYKLKLIAPDLTPTTLTMPTSTLSENQYGSARQFIDPISGHPGIWAALRIDNEWHRLSIDLITLTVTDDGKFAPVNAEISLAQGDSVQLDINGDLWESATLSSNVDLNDYVIVKRPILSSGNDFSVVWREEGSSIWYETPQPVVHIHGHNILFSGF